MKAVFYAPAALARFADVLEYTIQNFGETQADAYTAQLAARIEALAAGTGPRARRCELLMQGVRDASGLTCYREGSHFLILRERPDTLEVVEILHGRMNLDEHLEWSEARSSSVTSSGSLPMMIMPRTSSVVTSFRLTMSTILPWYMTAIR